MSHDAIVAPLDSANWSPLTAMSDTSASSTAGTTVDGSDSPSPSRARANATASAASATTSGSGKKRTTPTAPTRRKSTRSSTAQGPPQFDDDSNVASRVASRRATASTRSQDRKRRDKAKQEEFCVLCMAPGQVLTDEEEEANANKVWIQCDHCNTWYHWLCATDNKTDAPEDFDRWYCTSCISSSAKSDKPLVSTRKPEPRRTNRAATKLDYANLDAHLPADHLRWKRVIATRPIVDADFKKMKPEQLTDDWLYSDDSFDEPFLVERPEGLGMRMPASDTSISAIADAIGDDHPIEALDVAAQDRDKSIKTLRQWADYFENPKRDKVRNVISLEVGSTPFGEAIDAPEVVRKLDWVDQIWPKDNKEEGKYPQVQKYCLMSVAESWTDWHIDFAGSSVFYHILRGGKVFYFIRPTMENLKAYEAWSSDTARQEASWLGDQVDTVYRVELVPGNTMFIPTGWIHAVETPSDSLVIGGNFVHSLNIPTQLEVYRIELATKVPKKFRFPHFVTLLWHVANYYSPRLAAALASPSKSRPVDLSHRILVGLKAMSDFLIEQGTRFVKGAKGSNERIRVARANVPWSYVDKPHQLSRELRKLVLRALGEHLDALCDLPLDADSVDRSIPLAATTLAPAATRTLSPKPTPKSTQKGLPKPTSTPIPATNGLKASPAVSTSPALVPEPLPVPTPPAPSSKRKHRAGETATKTAKTATTTVSAAATPATTTTTTPTVNGTVEGGSKRKTSEAPSPSANGNVAEPESAPKAKRIRLPISLIPLPPAHAVTLSDETMPYVKTERDEDREDPGGRIGMGPRRTHVVESSSTKTIVKRWEENGKIFIDTRRVVTSVERLEFDVVPDGIAPAWAESKTNAEVVESYRRKKQSKTKGDEDAAHASVSTPMTSRAHSSMDVSPQMSFNATQPSSFSAPLPNYAPCAASQYNTQYQVTSNEPGPFVSQPPQTMRTGACYPDAGYYYAPSQPAPLRYGSGASSSPTNGTHPHSSTATMYMNGQSNGHVDLDGNASWSSSAPAVPPSAPSRATAAAPIPKGSRGGDVEMSISPPAARRQSSGTVAAPMPTTCSSTLSSYIHQKQARLDQILPKPTVLPPSTQI